MPAATIVITNHDYGRYVAAAIDSALAQTRRCQVVVVDNGSTDDSLDVIGRYGDRIEVVAQPNGGQASAFNSGFVRSLGELVLFLDADDALDPGAVAAVIDAFGGNPTAVRCQFGLRFVDAAGRRRDGGYPEPGRRLPRGDLVDRVRKNPDDVAWQPTSGNAFRRSVLDELLPMPTGPYRISADHYLSNLSALYGPVLAIDDVLGSYRVHGANADHRNGFDLERSRAILTRTLATRSLLIERGRQLGLAMPAGPERFRSLTHDALRLASYRSEPRADHPVPHDRRWRLLGRAVRSALGRHDLPAHRRVLAIGWVVALGIVPTRLVGTVAARGLTR